MCIYVYNFFARWCYENIILIADLEFYKMLYTYIFFLKGDQSFNRPIIFFTLTLFFNRMSTHFRYNKITDVYFGASINWLIVYSHYNQTKFGKSSYEGSPSSLDENSDAYEGGGAALPYLCMCLWLLCVANDACTDLLSS